MATRKKGKQVAVWQLSVLEGCVPVVPVDYLAQLKLRWYAEQNAVTKRILKPYLK